ncbi:hypothetical protein D3C74_317990 [compost metagenome]
MSKFKEESYTDGAKTKTYSVTIKSNEHTEQMAFQESEYFKESRRNATRLKPRIANLSTDVERKYFIF